MEADYRLMERVAKGGVGGFLTGRMNQVSSSTMSRSLRAAGKKCVAHPQPGQEPPVGGVAAKSCVSPMASLPFGFICG